MAKAKDDSSVEASGVEDSATALLALKSQVDELTKVVRALVERIEAVEKQPASGASGCGKGGGKSASVLSSAAVVAGAIAAGSSSNGLMTGAHEYTVALSAVRVAASLYRVADIVQDHPELLEGRIGQAYTDLEKILEQQAVHGGKSAGGL